jgi:hypothetical protein
MIRMKDTGGRVVLGLTRAEVKGLLEGKVCCFPAGQPHADAPHICVYFGETSADVLARLREAYPDEASQAAFAEPLDLRTRPARGDN